MWAPKLRTPGMARSSLLASVVIRTSSGCDVDGSVTQCIRKSRSLNSGSNVLTELRKVAMPIATTTSPTVANA